MRLHHKTLLSLLLLASHTWGIPLIAASENLAQAYPPVRHDSIDSRSSTKYQPSTQRRDRIDREYEDNFSDEDVPDPSGFDENKIQKLIKETLYDDQQKLVDEIDEFTREKLLYDYNIKVDRQVDLYHGVYRSVAEIHQERHGVRKRFRVFFDHDGEIARVTYLDSIEEQSEAWKLIARLTQATNNGSLEGQLRCFAKTVSPYYNHGVLAHSSIMPLLHQWKNRYSYYNMEVIHKHVTASTNLLYDFDVRVKFRVTWKDAEGRYKHKQIFDALYSVSSRDRRPKIVAAQVLKMTKAY